MKTKLVLWGTNANDERTLIAMELRPELNQVGTWLFPESIATDEFAKQLFDEWRESKEVPFPEGFTYREQELTMTESLLPDDIKVERTDIVQRAQAEWHFIVLSSKLQEAYHSELEELKDRVERLESFDPGVWENLKSFWDKVQNQVRERNLFRDHIESLRENTNALFERLKELRKKMDDEFSKQSRETMQKFMTSLEEIEQKIKEGLRLQSAFDELKKVQREYRDAQMTRDHRSKVWDRLDGMFKAVKEKRFGGEAGSDDSPLLRIQRRYNGLLEAIQKMERSIKRDKDDLNFQAKKIATTDGQLEAQIRQAKITMIEERIRSKEDKLNEMVHTRTDLEGRMERIRQRQAKEQEKEKLEEAKEHAKEKIAEQIKQQQAEMEEISDKLEKAAESLTGDEAAEAEAEAEAEPSLREKVEEAVEDAVDTIKAIAEVAEEKIEDVVEKAEDKVEEVVEKAKAKRKKKAAPESAEEEPSLLEKVEDAVEKAVDTVKEIAEDAAERVEEIAEKLTGDDDDDDDDKKEEA
jgi:chromosome segregation ATPase